MSAGLDGFFMRLRIPASEDAPAIAPRGRLDLGHVLESRVKRTACLRRVAAVGSWPIAHPRFKRGQDMAHTEYCLTVNASYVNTPPPGKGYIISAQGGSIDPSKGAQIRTVDGVMRLFGFSFAGGKFEINVLHLTTIIEIILFAPEFPDGQPFSVTPSDPQVVTWIATTVQDTGEQ